MPSFPVTGKQEAATAGQLQPGDSPLPRDPPVLTQHFPLLWGTYLRQGGREAKKEREECVLSCRSELKLETLGGEVTTPSNKLPSLGLPCCKRQVHPDSGEHRWTAANTDGQQPSQDSTHCKALAA